MSIENSVPQINKDVLISRETENLKRILNVVISDEKMNNSKASKFFSFISPVINKDVENNKKLSRPIRDILDSELKKFSIAIPVNVEEMEKLLMNIDSLEIQEKIKKGIK